jgi:hypothetical protein
MVVKDQSCNSSTRKWSFFLSYVHQKSVNSSQIIPLFTLVWDDKSKSKREKITRGFKARLVFRLSLCLSKSCEDP